MKCVLDVSFMQLYLPFLSLGLLSALNASYAAADSARNATFSTSFLTSPFQHFSALEKALGSLRGEAQAPASMNCFSRGKQLAGNIYYLERSFCDDTPANEIIKYSDKRFSFEIYGKIP